MREVRLEAPADFEGWRRAVRDLVLDCVPADRVAWTIAGETTDLLATSTMNGEVGNTRHFKVPRPFISLAREVICHRDPARFATLHRVLARIHGGDRDILGDSIDEDVHQAETWAKAVRRDSHKMKAFVRFREVETQESGHACYVAWFEPDNHIVELTAPFFQRRFTTMHWSILTPTRSAHWDGSDLKFAAGASRSDAPNEDALEDYWRTYFSSIFNPARLKLSAMRSEMPKKYWHNLPEASAIRALVHAAADRAQIMISDAPTEPRFRAGMERDLASAREEKLSSVASADEVGQLRHRAEACTACPLWEHATQTVFGEGPTDARVMFVGEQPGDQEDLAGRPFVGPAGAMLDRALAEAGIDRSEIYLTNAVKHFKFVARGKRRIHQTPAAGEITACRPWYEAELAMIDPDLIVALGATAARAVFGRAMPIGRNRGRILSTPDGRPAVITVHPSYLLRLPDEAAKREQYALFVKDLRLAA